MLNSGGVHSVIGQTKGQSFKPTRGRVKRIKVGAMGPIGLVRKPPPSGGGGGVSAVNRAMLSPADHFGWLWGPQKYSQK